ncbi:hypothetical protein NNJEOMEG_03886 [Fundidesulfovibrio magnetotacticus]|uniref:Uncharacterized protein n=1 Tax=Fundidesulfovibrio magnetotacticus TaxID=2730080 RepID=A0A6V8LU62_9BACT|nr:hypothetical protein [Fundidesulfovibrio magnetotacticus]GFK96012.1 hypothetical protein NNJEOMEG_03886 [Fundidesulfovibrio magnetotacticus]
MPTFPVFSAVFQAMAVFGLHLGKLVKWALVPLALTAAAAALAVGAAVLGKGLLAEGSRAWWLAAVPAALFVGWAWAPYGVRVNQLAVWGRVEQGGYMAQMVSGRVKSFLGYMLLVALIQLAGLGLSAAPFLVSMSRGDRAALAGGAVSALLALSFLVLTSPLNLICTAASVTPRPSLGQVFHLASGARWRLFWLMFLPAALFAVLGEALTQVSNAFGADKTVLGFVVFMPAQVLLTFFSSVTSTAAPGVAWRMLSGLPDPRGAASGSGGAASSGPESAPESAPESGPEPVPASSSDPGHGQDRP